ncbi:hypothetical protein [Actinomadura geliboluensis]|uniref:hypothetical protein n=1 Tax=Actinomadura geliboluensis TaxID=882440 RepID=UPI002603A5F1|nr:hypothetical protein [Actinomadura geliboluensis]
MRDTTTGETATMRETATGQTTIRPVEPAPIGTAVLVRAVLAAVTSAMAAAVVGAVAAGGARLARAAGRGTVGVVRLLRAHWYRVCGAVLVAAAVAGLVAMLAGPLLLAVAGR